MMKQPPFETERIYHVYNHGNGDDNLFRTEENYRYFLQKYAEYIHPVAATYAYCLMPNHFHLVIRIRSAEELRAFYRLKKKLPEETVEAKTLGGFETLQALESGELGLELLQRLVSQQFSHFLNGYTQAFNKRHDRSGSLFRQNIKRKLITDDTYYTRLIRYVHYNPVHHGFVRHLDDWPHSSYHAFLSVQPTRLCREEVLEWFGDRNNFLESHCEIPTIPLDFEL
ncbi:MAG: hypothetical protein V4714_18290 [Bacteroidota bacterium]